MIGSRLNGRRDMGVEPEWPAGVVEVEDDEAREGERRIAKGLGDDIVE